MNSTLRPLRRAKISTVAPVAAGEGTRPAPAPAFAQTAPTTGPAWRVPSLQMLEATQGTRQGTGYTRFTITAERAPALQKASYYTYAIRVNGTPVLINGWAPESVRVGIDAAKGGEDNDGGSARDLVQAAQQLPGPLARRHREVHVVIHVHL